MYAESYKVIIFAIAAIGEQLGILKISYNTDMINQRNTVLTLPPVKLGQSHKFRVHELSECSYSIQLDCEKKTYFTYQYIHGHIL